ncbi:MAG: hypothetical protein IPI67_16390 [Myxococcales bacterium]|nr:hypothetical protein [Myxococcales bacterium]
MQDPKRSNGSAKPWAGKLAAPLFALAFALGCGGGPAKSANPTRALDERRAVQVIAQAFHDEHDAPVPGRPVQIAEGKLLEVDVMSDGRKYGVAYIAPNERQALGAALPKKAPEMGDALQLVHGIGSDSDTRVLILQDTDYRYDDQVGTAHEETTITAERRLARDVRDFLVRAHSERWP